MSVDNFLGKTFVFQPRIYHNRFLPVFQGFLGHSFGAGLSE
jgi:hypothetical protein